MPAVGHEAGRNWSASGLPVANGDGPAKLAGTLRLTRPDLLVRVALFFLYLGMFFLPMIQIKFTHSRSVSDVFFSLSALLLVLSIRQPLRAPKTTAWFFGAFLVTVGGMLSSVNASSTLGSLQVVSNGIFVLIVWQWSTRQLLDVPLRTQSAMSAYAFGTTVSAAVAIIQQVGHTNLGFHPASGATTRAVGLAQQPNVAGVTFGLAVVFLIGLIFARGLGRFQHRLVFLLVLGLALMFTGSVSGMASVLVGTFLLLLLRGFGIRKVLVAAIVIVGVYLGGTHLEGHGKQNLNPFARLAATTGQNTGYNTVDTRIATIKNAWTGIQKSPIIGHGLDAESSITYVDPYIAGGTPYPTHDFFLLLWYEGGIFLLLGVGIAMASALSRLLRRPRDPTKDTLLAGVVVLLIYAVQAPELFDRWLWLPFVLAMTLRPKVSPAPSERFQLAAKGNPVPGPN